MGYRLINATTQLTIEDDETLAYVRIDHVTSFYERNNKQFIQQPIDTVPCSDVYAYDGKVIIPQVNPLEVNRYHLAEFKCPRPSQWDKILTAYGGFSTNETILTQIEVKRCDDKLDVEC